MKSSTMSKKLMHATFREEGALELPCGGRVGPVRDTWGKCSDRHLSCVALMLNWEQAPNKMISVLKNPRISTWADSPLCPPAPTGW